MSFNQDLLNFGFDDADTNEQWRGALKRSSNSCTRPAHHIITIRREVFERDPWVVHSARDFHVRKMVEYGLLKERRYGNLRMIKPSFESLTLVFKKGLGVKTIRT